MGYDLAKYYKIFASVPELGLDYNKNVSFLSQKLSTLFVDDYAFHFPDSEILEFDVNGYSYLFALHQSHADSTDNDDRVVAAYGRVSHTDAVRDTSRMKGFIGQFTKISHYQDYDKGHFISHKINGSLDQNLYPQLKELNRGWSKQGKLFRSFERYCEQNPDVFVFTRPIYSDSLWIPKYIDYGIYTKESGLLLNRFDNKKIQLTGADDH
jgi:DNA/RNA non-specific endonuclease